MTDPASGTVESADIVLAVEIPPEAAVTAAVILKAVRATLANAPFGCEPLDFLVALDEQADALAGERTQPA